MDKVKLIANCEKIFPEKTPRYTIKHIKAARNQVVSFQVAIKTRESFMKTRKVFIESDISDHIKIREVRQVPSLLAVYDEKKRDDYFLSVKSRLYPDALVKTDCEILCPPKKWVSLWITLKSEKGLPVGEHKIAITVEGENSRKTVHLIIEIVEIELPKNDLIITNWLHYDCICETYHVEPFDEKFYGIVKKHYISQVEHGCTMIYLPLFTPPLDTAIGRYRKTVQSVKVTLKGGKYSFDFTELKRLLELAKSVGYRYFEFSHLFTQWGAKCPPKIVAHTENGEERIFGWEDDSLSEKFLGFLGDFLAALNIFVKENGIKDRCFIHLSDEPKEKDFGRYKIISDFIKQKTDIKFMEAISDPLLFAENKVDMPCVSLDSYHKFDDLKGKIIYTCCEEYDRNLTNRFMCMPYNRTRVLGVQMYLAQVKGYLHWGYNFYHSELSYKTVNPYEITDGCGGFPSGDAFIVYPDAERGEVVDSIRHEAFYDAIQDYNALLLYESKFGRDKTVKLINDAGAEGFEKYPHNDRWLDELRERIYDETIKI